MYDRFWKRREPLLHVVTLCERTLCLKTPVYGSFYIFYCSARLDWGHSSRNWQLALRSHSRSVGKNDAPLHHFVHHQLSNSARQGRNMYKAEITPGRCCLRLKQVNPFRKISDQVGHRPRPLHVSRRFSLVNANQSQVQVAIGAIDQTQRE